MFNELKEKQERSIKEILSFCQNSIVIIDYTKYMAAYKDVILNPVKNFNVGSAVASGAAGVDSKPHWKKEDLDEIHPSRVKRVCKFKNDPNGKRVVRFMEPIITIISSKPGKEKIFQQKDPDYHPSLNNEQRSLLLKRFKSA